MAIQTTRESYHANLLRLEEARPPTIQSEQDLAPFCPHLHWQQIQTVFINATKSDGISSFSIPACFIKNRVHILTLYKEPNAPHLQATITLTTDNSFQDFKDEALNFANKNWPKELRDSKKWKSTGRVLFKSPTNFDTRGIPNTLHQIFWAAKTPFEKILSKKSPEALSKAWNAAIVHVTADPIEGREFLPKEELSFCTSCAHELSPGACTTCQQFFAVRSQNTDFTRKYENIGGLLPEKIAAVAKANGFLH